MRQQGSRARANWDRLKNIIRTGTLAAKAKHRRLHLFERHTQHAQDHLLTTLATPTHLLKQKSPLPLYKELLHFQGDVDATGRWVWEAEEVAAYFFLQTGEAIIAEALMRENSENGRVRILELGAGSSGMAGVALWQVGAGMKGVQPELQLTDGEPDNIPFLVDNITLNTPPASLCSARRLLWGEGESAANLALGAGQRQSFEVIIVCDCLYFETFHKQLLSTIDSYLSEGGLAFLVNPSRGHSQANFAQLAGERGFLWSETPFHDQKYQTQCQSAQVDPTYQDDKHRLFFNKLCRK